MYHYLIPLLEKKPEHLILHVSTNVVVNYEGKEIADILLQLNHLFKKSPHDQRYTFKADNEC